MLPASTVPPQSRISSAVISCLVVVAVINIFSSHLLPDVEAVCDHVLVLGRGSLLAQGNIQEMKQAHPRSFDVRLHTTEPPWAALGRQRRDRGAAAASIVSDSGRM